MGSRGGGGGVGVQSIPAASRKMVQSLKEIVNCPEPEIYSVLKDCNMDPNEAVNRLLSQDPFHEVKSKREKKKETKDPTESRPRGAGSTSNRGARSGADRYAGRGGSAQFSSSESGGLQGKPSYTSSSASISGTAGNNSSRRPPALSDSLFTESKASTESGVDGIISAPQPPSGYQSAWLGVPGQKSMADIVKMGRPQNKSYSPNPSYHNVNHNLTPAPPSTSTHQTLRSSEDYTSKVSELHHDLGAAPEQHVSPDDEWPLMEPPQVSMSSVLEPRADAELHSGTSNLSYDRSNQYLGSSTSEVQEEDDGAFEDHGSNHVDSASVSTRKMEEDNTGSASLYDDEMYKNIGSYHTQEHAYEHQEVEDVDASVSSVNANMQQLSMQEEDHRTTPEDDGPSVVIPNHLQVQTADCSHLSFGSFGSGMNTAFSGTVTSRAVRSNLEETPAEADASSVGHSDSRNPEYYGDESLRTSSDGNLVHRIGGSAGTYDSAAVSHPEVLKQENAEVAHGNQYTFPSATPGYNFENAQLLNTSFPQSQASGQMQNLTPFSSVTQAYTNSLPSSLLGANGHPVRESDLSYSPFPITQSMPAKYSNTVSSISSSTISMAEALKTVGFSSTQPTQQTPPGNNVATGPTLPQHLAVHPYSQPTLPLGPFANMIGYPFLPQSYTYMPSGFQQAFAGNSTYHQSLAAAVLPQYKNSVSVSSLPQSAAVASGYGAFGSSATIPGNYPMNPPAAPAGPSMSYDDVLSSQYKDNNHLLSLQQQTENSAMWLHGAGSRTMSAVPASTYYSFQGQNQQPGGFRQGQQPSQNFGALGYPNFYHSQTGISLEHQQQQNPRDGSIGGSQGQPKQSQQIWQNGY